MDEADQPLCGQLLLLLLNSDGKPVAGRTTGYLLAGALLADLVLRGRVDIAGPAEMVQPGRVLVRGTMPTGDALLDTALERVRQHQGAEPSTVIGPLSKGTRRAVLERLTLIFAQRFGPLFDRPGGLSCIRSGGCGCSTRG